MIEKSVKSIIIDAWMLGAISFKVVDGCNHLILPEKGLDEVYVLKKDLLVDLACAKHCVEFCGLKLCKNTSCNNFVCSLNFNNPLWEGKL